MNESTLPLILFEIITSSLVIGTVSIPLLQGKVAMNKYYGIRIKKAFKSKANWDAINKYGGKQMLIWSIISVLVCVPLAVVFRHRPSVLSLFVYHRCCICSPSFKPIFTPTSCLDGRYAPPALFEMSGIYLTAILTTAIAVGVFGTLIHKLRLPADERLLWLAAALALPLQPLAFYLVRVPLDHWLVAQLGATSATYKWLITFYAPLTEEPAKLFPLLIPAIRRDISPANFVRYALAIGVAFAIGEMWFIADRVARMPDLAALSFYQFGGYVSERLMVCVFHSAFVAVALWRLRQRFALGFLGAAALHWFGNFPISLMAWNTGGLGKTLWMVFVQFFLLLYFLGAMALLCWFAFRQAARVRTGDTANKPGCAKELS